jgi:predicted nucleic acid-binding Zn ribbon protein
MTREMPGTGRHAPRAGKEHEPEEIGKILKRWMSRNRIRERVSDQSVFGRWKDVVGPEIAAATRVVRLAGGVLTVEVSSAPLLNELATYHREEILSSLQAIEGMGDVRQIRFRAGAS